ncbi:MAG: DUF5103 domain-containing protein [Chitinophagaceae bacterium]|nr:DUF5103 domain-containing protein [Chitinophagaceae bacterium]
MKRFRLCLIFAFSFYLNTSVAIAPDSIFMPNIKTVRLFVQGNQLSFPVITLNGNDRLQLFFDDLDGDVKNYYYTYELCNFDWTPSGAMQLDYIKGFTQNRITDYRFSSVALTRYTHYNVYLPQSNSMLTRGGNYILRVYLDGDTSKVAFTKRLLVLDPRVSIKGAVTQPFTPKYFNTHQKVIFNVDLKGINDYNAVRQTHVVVLQNYVWQKALMDMQPTFIRGNNLEFNSENSAIFPGGKEWRWLDLRDFHLQSDRVRSADYNKRSTSIYLFPDASWAGKPYIYYKDIDGLSLIEAVRGINPDFEGDYATVYFSLSLPDKDVYTGKDIYLFGELTNYSLVDSLKMKYNEENGLYETHLLLKQGYYDYTYLVKDAEHPTGSTNVTEGNYFETENTYMILVYYRPFGARADQLVGVALINSRDNQPGMSF